MQKNPWKKLSTKTVYKNQWIKVIEDKFIRPNGQKGIYAYVKTRADSVFIVPMTKNNNVYLVKLFRYITRNYSWEIPGGNSDGEDLLKAAKRELQEETGFISKKWNKIGNFQAMNGVVDETGHVFIARNLIKTKRDNQLEENIVQMKRVSFKKVLKMISENEITDAHSIIAISKVALKLKIGI